VHPTKNEINCGLAGLGEREEKIEIPELSKLSKIGYLRKAGAEIA
jgi:hypothetical protein